VCLRSAHFFFYYAPPPPPPKKKHTKKQWAVSLSVVRKGNLEFFYMQTLQGATFPPNKYREGRQMGGKHTKFSTKIYLSTTEKTEYNCIG
jgi:hypothetical protein